MTSADDFPAYARLANALIERATKNQLADVTRLLALNCGYPRFAQDILLKMSALRLWTKKPSRSCRLGCRI